MKRRRAKRVQTVSGTSNDCSRGDGRRRWSLNSYASIGKQKARIGGTRNERWSPERRACFFARLRKQTCQTSVDLLDHKRRRLFLHRSGSRFFINIQAKPAVSQARSAAEGTFIFTALWPSSPPATLDTQNETTILRDVRPVRRTQPQTCTRFNKLVKHPGHFAFSLSSE